MSIVEVASSSLDQHPKKQKRFCYKEGVCARKFIDNGVKKIMILAAVPNLKENYANVSQVLQVLNIDNLNYFGMFDYKLANIFFGIEAASSSHPCVYCEIPSKDIKAHRQIARNR